MTGEDVCAFGDGEVLDHLHDKFRGNHKKPPPIFKQLLICPLFWSWEDHHVDRVFVFLEPS